MMAVDISEVERPLARRRIDFYLALIFLVAPVWCIVPACWVFAFYTTATRSFYTYGWKGHTLYFIALFEVLFSLYYAYLVKVTGVPTTTPIRSVEELEIALDRVLKAGLANLSEDANSVLGQLQDSRPSSPDEDIIQLEHDDPKAVDFRNAFRTWFNGAKWSEVRKHEVRQWLYWAMFNSALPPEETLKPEFREPLDRAIKRMEKRIGRTIPEGSSPHIRPFLLSLDKLNVYSRPFIVYAFIYLMNVMSQARLERKYQLNFTSYKGLEYAYRIPESWDPNSDTRPIVFFHGLGLGLSQYKIALSRIIRNFGDRPLLVVLQPHVSQNIFHPSFLKPMNREETTERLATLLDELGWANLEKELPKDESSEKRIAAQKGVTMLSHSNGTYGHAWMLKDYQHMITRSCFVDPVAFCTWEGDLCYNFLYRRCTTGLDVVMRYFVSSELGIANLMQRQFDWCSNALWYEEIPNARDNKKTLFILGGKDSIVKAQRVREYLASHGVRSSLYFDKNGRHGQPFILAGESHKKIMTWLRQG